MIAKLVDLGYDTRGPVVRDGAIMPGVVTGVTDLPAGYHDEQSPGHYRLRATDDGMLFGWAVGPGSYKADFFPPQEELWRAEAGPPGGEGDEQAVAVTLRQTGSDPAQPHRPLAIIGARPCELAGLDVLDRVFVGGAAVDPGYAERRRDSFVVVAECGAPAATCFCTSMGTGPAAGAGFDLALTELPQTRGLRYLIRIGTERGADVLSGLPVRDASEADLAARDRLLRGAEAAMSRSLETPGLPELLSRNIDHPRWADVAERCLACGNCTLVCPTCFCSDVRDTTDVTGAVSRHRVWSSCFDLDHSYLAGQPVHASTASRYRQWLTHKLSTWWDQFDTSGCVGCGRCISWCPVGIDLTEEAAAIRAADGAGTRDTAAGAI